MINCPNCKHQELSGALFCSECGAQMRDFGHWNTHSLKKEDTESAPENNVSVQLFNVDQSAEVKNNHIEIVRLKVIEANQTINLHGQSEYTLGRVSEDQPIIPDVDLTEFEAFIQGVSRLHAALKVGNQRISIMDLGSSNGTRVNGQKIVPHVDYPLKPGDAIALGNLIIQIVVSNP